VYGITTWHQYEEKYRTDYLRLHQPLSVYTPPFLRADFLDFIPWSVTSMDLYVNARVDRQT